MGVFLSLDESNQVLFIRFEGVVTDDVFLDRYQIVREWIAAHGFISNISDFTEVISFQVTAQAIGQLAAHSPLVPDGFQRIVVAPQDQVFGMTRMFEMLGSPTRDKVHIVRTVTEAFILLGIEAPNLCPLLEW
jgi:hypothetical protein